MSKLISVSGQLKRRNPRRSRQVNCGDEVLKSTPVVVENEPKEVVKDIRRRSKPQRN